MMIEDRHTMLHRPNILKQADLAQLKLPQITIPEVPRDGSIRPRMQEDHELREGIIREPTGLEIMQHLRIQGHTCPCVTT
jgi:hypothetical protein